MPSLLVDTDHLPRTEKTNERAVVHRNRIPLTDN